MRAAKVMGVAPWDLLVQPNREYWRDFALAMDSAEAEGQRMAREFEGFGGDD